MKPMRMLTLLAGVMVVSGYFLLTPGQAQQAGGTAVAFGVVDIPQVFRESVEIRDLKKSYSAEQDRLKGEADSQNKSLLALREVLSKLNVDSPEFKKRSSELMYAVINYRVWAEEVQRDLEMRHRLQTERFYQSIMDVIRGIATQNNLHLILYKDDYEVKADTADMLLEKIQQRKVLYNSPGVDYTRKVIEKLNGEYKGPLPAPALIPPPTPVTPPTPPIPH